MRIVVCDICGQPDLHTTRYRIARGTDASHFDLCTEHAAPVEQVIATKAQVFDPPTPDPDEEMDDFTRRKLARARGRK